MTDEEMAWLDEQMATQASEMSLADDSSCAPPAVPQRPKAIALPSFIETGFTTRAAYTSWVQAGADRAMLP